MVDSPGDGKCHGNIPTSSETANLASKFKEGCRASFSDILDTGFEDMK